MTEQKKTRRKYTPEFRKEAAALVINHGYTHKQAAETVGTSEKNLHRWVHDEQCQPGCGLDEAEQEELQRLRKEVRQLRLEREILKKATAFFAKETK